MKRVLVKRRLGTMTLIPYYSSITIHKKLKFAAAKEK
jgi:hypothetical protein